MKIYCIYKITSPVGRIYIGQTCDFVRRMRAYKRHACKEQKLLYNSIVKYGWENHVISIVEENLSEEEVDNKETLYIKQYKSFWKTNRDTGLNLLEFGNSFRGQSKESLCKPILQYDIKGRFLKEWGSTRDAEIACNIQRTSISACLRGLYNNAGLYMWRYKTGDIYPLKIKALSGKKLKLKWTIRYSTKPKGRSIKVYDIINKEIRYFSRIKDCVAIYGIKPFYINRLLKSGNKYYKKGLYFKYNDLSEMQYL